jgi:predicted ATP-grasp superfamily ATP-dependent carboligase
MRQLPGILLPTWVSGSAVLSSLKLAGIPAIVFSYHARAAEMQSRYPRKKILFPAEGDHEPHLLEALRELSAEGGVILPTKDWHVAALNSHRAELERRFRLCLPPGEVIDALMDKGREVSLMRAHGFEVPDTLDALPAHPRELISALGLPVILKPRLPSMRLGRKIFFARTEGDLEAVYAQLGPRVSDLVAQAHIPGGPETLWLCNAVYDGDHALVSAFVFRKVRTNPVQNGVTAVAVSASNPEIVALARAFGERLRYTGPADLEFKRDPRTGKYVYIETNPRFTMSCEFAARCGVNHVEDAYRVALGERPRPRPRAQRDGVRYFNADFYVQAKRRAGAPLLSTQAGVLKHQLLSDVKLVNLDWRDPWPYGFRVLRAVFRLFAFLPRRLARRGAPR